VLKLLESAKGPILEDFPEDAPGMTGQPSQVLQVACPVNFSNPKDSLSTKEKLLDSFAEEFSQMKTWYEVAMLKNKRTTVGVSGLSPEEVSEYLAAFVRGEMAGKNIGDTLIDDGLRMVAEDLKAFYFEAVSAQPGQPTDSKSLADWFWGQTSAALVINEVRKISLQEGSKKMALLGNLLLIPRSQMHRFKD